MIEPRVYPSPPYRHLLRPVVASAAHSHACRVSLFRRHTCIALGHLGLLSPLVLNATMSVNAQDAQGRAPLHVAAASNQPRAAQFLLKHSANPDAKDSEGRTALDIAVLYRWKDMQRVLCDPSLLFSNRTARATKLYKQGEYELACDGYKAAVGEMSRMPSQPLADNRAVVYFNYARSAQSMGRLTHAAELFTHVLEAVPRHERALDHRSECYAALYDYDSAIADLKELTQSFKPSVEAATVLQGCRGRGLEAARATSVPTHPNHQSLSLCLCNLIYQSPPLPLPPFACHDAQRARVPAARLLGGPPGRWTCEPRRRKSRMRRSVSGSMRRQRRSSARTGLHAYSTTQTSRPTHPTTAARAPATCLHAYRRHTRSSRRRRRGTTQARSTPQSAPPATATTTMTTKITLRAHTSGHPPPGGVGPRLPPTNMDTSELPDVSRPVLASCVQMAPPPPSSSAASQSLAVRVGSACKRAPQGQLHPLEASAASLQLACSSLSTRTRRYALGGSESLFGIVRGLQSVSFTVPHACARDCHLVH